MRLAIAHAAERTYSETIPYSIQYVRLWPREEACQKLVSWRLKAPGPAMPWRDGFGNLVHTVVVMGPHDRVEVSAGGEVDTDDTHGILPPEETGLPAEAFLRSTHLTEPDEAVRDLARLYRPQPGKSTLPALHALMADLHDEIDVLPPGRSQPEGAARTLARKAGLCQDLSHLFVACCLSWGQPARFVSGYLSTAGAEDGRQSGTHAWAETLVEDLGWVSFDPVHRLCATQAYVRLAVAFDSEGAAPLRGARAGGGDEKLRIRLQVQQIQE